jgi:secondary thiamine-phosphate synthase enzyme
MRIVSETLVVETNQRVELMDLTIRVKELVARSEIQGGMVNVYSLHTTTAVFLNESQEALLEDMRDCLTSLVDDSGWYKHNSPQFSDCDRRNATSHLRSMLLGSSTTLPVENGQLLLGPFQSVLFAELDGPRERQIRLQVMGE